MLYLLPSPIGNLGDITLRVLEVLQKGEVFLCEDTRITQKLLSLLEQKKLLQNQERSFFPLHSHNQDAFLKELDPSFFNSVVVFMSDAGMPCVSDPGSALVRYAQKHHLPYEVLPAGSAVTLAYAYSGFGDGGFVFDGFLPHKGVQRRERFGYWKEALASCEIPLVVFESPHRLQESLEDLQKIDEQCEVFLIKEMTKKFQQSFLGSIKEVIKGLEGKNTQGEWVFVIKFSHQTKEKKLGQVEICEFDIPLKIKAKLLSKITGETPKNLYQRLLKECQ